MKTVISVVALLLLNLSGIYSQDTLAVNKEVPAPSVDSTSVKGVGQVPEADLNHKVVAPWFVERFKISAGFFVPLSNTSIEVTNHKRNDGTQIDFEDDLGLKTATETFLADFQWRASRRSRFDLSFYKLNRSATHTINKDINFADSTYKTNSTVHGFFNTDIWRFSYGYALLAKPKYELGLMIGAHVVRANVGLGIVTRNDTINASSDFGVTAPLPNVGIWGGYVFNDRLAVNGEFEWLSLTVGDINGRILAYNVSFMYKLFRNLHLSLGYLGLNCRVDVTKTDRSGNLKWGNNGPAFSAAFSFGKRPWVH
jgi:hypothetical protein